MHLLNYWPYLLVNTCQPLPLHSIQPSSDFDVTKHTFSSGCNGMSHTPSDYSTVWHNGWVTRQLGWPNFLEYACHPHVVNRTLRLWPYYLGLQIGSKTVLRFENWITNGEAGSLFCNQHMWTLRIARLEWNKCKYENKLNWYW